MRIPQECRALLFKAELERLNSDDGISLLEHLAHNLTISVRIAADSRRPFGSLTDEQARLAMYWINEALHNVVQLTRDLRIGRETWDAQTIDAWVRLWLSYEHADGYIRSAVERAFRDLPQS